MFIIKSVCVIVVMAFLLGTQMNISNLQITIEQNATGNVTKVGNTEGLILKGQSTAHPVDCIIAKKQVSSLGLSFTASNDTGKVKGWWNIPSSEGGNNVGGKISNANVDKNMFEVKGTMIYENHKNEKNSIFHQLELRKIKITSLAGPE